MKQRGIRKLNDFRSDITDKIVCNMMDELNSDQAEKLKNILVITLNDYEISKRELSLTTYNGNEIEYMVKKFLITKKVQGCTERTLGVYGREIPKILYKINKPLKDITSDDILIYIANRDIKDRVSKTTQDTELRYIRTFFAFLLSEEYITRNPCLKIKKIRGEKIKKRAFSDIEIEKIRNACNNNKEKAMIETLLSTGCRVSELVQIRRDRIEDNKIEIVGKGQKSRIVYFNAKAQVTIQNYLSERNDSNPYLFPRMLNVVEARKISKEMIDYKNKIFVRDDGHCDKCSIEQTIRWIGGRAQVKETHPHRFRRTCATLALKRGMPLMQVSKMLGHESVATTQIYLDISEEELEQSHKKYVV